MRRRFVFNSNYFIILTLKVQWKFYSRFVGEKNKSVAAVDSACSLALFNDQSILFAYPL